LLQVKDFNLELERKIQEVTASLEAAHDELMRKEKLATVGQLTAGIAHEIRNPLLIIKGSAEMLQKRVTKHGELIRDIREEADRVNRIVTELLEYARPLSPVTQEINLGLLFDQAWTRMERLACGDGKEIGLDKQISATSFIEADPTLLEQALVNLLMNARQAISRRGEIGVKDIATHDGFLQLQITDNGSGIAPEDLPKVFSPFFTKRKGGIGLGLSMAQKTIEAHGGKITMESVAGKGTKVTLRLPQRGSSPDKGVRDSDE
jgi:signal transduction histidine kinase